MEDELKTILYLVVGLTIGAVLAGVISYGSYGGNYMMNNMMGGGMWIWWILIPILIIVILIAFTREEGTTKDTYTGDRALQILREKYAEGEITKEEFEEKKRKLH